MDRVVLDANVVVSGVLSPDGVCGRILARAIRGRTLRTVVSFDILAEVRRSLLYRKVQRRHGLTVPEVDALVGSLAMVSDVVRADRIPRAVKADPDDDLYVAAAVEGRAGFLVSGDRHVLAVGSWEGVRILSPRDFLDLLEATEGGDPGS